MHEVYPPFKCRGGESPHVGHHPSAQVDQKALPIGPEIEHHLPDAQAEIDVFIFLARVYLNDIVSPQSWYGCLEYRQAMCTGVPVGEYKYVGIAIRLNKVIQCG